MNFEEKKEEVKIYALNKFQSNILNEYMIDQLIMESICDVVESAETIKDLEEIKEYYSTTNKEEILKNTIEFCYNLLCEKNKQLKNMSL